MTRAIVIVIDRLAAGFLGPYGNTWIETPNLNRFAAESILFENLISDDPSIKGSYGAYFSGVHAALPAKPPLPLLPTALNDSGVKTFLAADDPSIVSTDWESEFQQAHHLPPADHFASAENIESTQLARYFASTLDIYEREIASEQSYLMWCHCQGVSGAWDAPLDYRDRFADEDDPVPPRDVRPPELRLGSDVTPDELFGYMCAYAGQIAILDECLGAFFESISQAGDDDTMIVLTSPRGFPLGEHFGVGAVAPELYSELIQTPLLIRLPGANYAASRSQTIVQPQQLYQTLARWFDPSFSAGGLLESANEISLNQKKIAVAACNDECLVRTSAWLARIPELANLVAGEPGSEIELFLKPDDRWDANDVADRCPDVVSAVSEYACAIRQGMTDAVEFPDAPAILFGDDG